jgi:hypothetical protein
MRSIKWFSAALAMAALTAYAHAASIAPDLDKIAREPSRAPMEAKVFYYIAPTDLDKQVTAQGPKGATLQFQPYKDIEAGFHKMLTNVFTDVSRIQAPDPSQSDTFVYVVRMSMTTAVSPSPGEMSVTLNCVVDDENGHEAAQIRVTGHGKSASGDVTVAGQHAAEQALLKMQKAMLAEPHLQQ